MFSGKSGSPGVRPSRPSLGFQLPTGITLHIVTALQRLWLLIWIITVRSHLINGTTTQREIKIQKHNQQENQFKSASASREVHYHPNSSHSSLMVTLLSFIRRHLSQASWNFSHLLWSTILSSLSQSIYQTHGAAIRRKWVCRCFI